MPMLAGALSCALLTTVVAAGCASSTVVSSDRALAARDATSFLDRYVSGDGRVVRRDQGSDTVSEGQGYGLLLSFVTNQRHQFDKIWSWTEQHLQQPNALFAYHWSGGSVVSPTPAADADSQIAWALDLAGTRWHVPRYLTAAKKIAVAIAQREIGYDAKGRPTLAAGPWAVHPAPVIVEPGYWTFPADNALAALIADNRWRALAAADLAHLRLVTGDGKQLPPDWAREGSTVVASTASGGSGASAVSGQDGMRAIVWASCTSGGRSLGRQWWQLLSSTASQAPLARSRDGAPADHNASPLAAVAAAVSAAASGDTQQRDNLLQLADHIDQQYPTYYGSAWAALGRVVSVSDMLPGCGSHN
jgi:endoglucanase